MLSIIYGNPPMRSYNEPSIKVIMEYVKDMTDATAPGKHLTQLIPALEYLPLWMAPWKRAALEGHEHYTRLFMSLLDEGKNRPVSTMIIISIRKSKMFRPTMERKPLQVLWERR